MVEWWVANLLQRCSPLLWIGYWASMSVCKTVSWNTRGLNSKIKRSLVFQFLQRQSPHMYSLGDSSDRGKTMSLRRPWVGHSATHITQPTQIFQEE